MKLGRRLAWVLVCALALVCGVLGARLTQRLSAGLDAPHFELGRRRSASVTEATRARLAGFDEEVRLTYFVTRKSELPAHLAHLEERVRDVLGAFAAATAARPLPFTIDVVHPDDHPEWQTWLASAGVAPWRARRVEGDGYRDDELWSSLRIGYGARPAAVFNGVGPEMVDQLQELILAQLDELRQARRPRVAISAPSAGYDVLREVLRSGAELVEVDFDASAELPADVDLFVWLDGTEAGAAHLAAIDRLRARGGSSIFAGSDLRSTETWSGEELSVEFQRVTSAPSTVLEHFGLAPLEGLLLDDRGAEMLGPANATGAQPSKITPWLVRSTADQQDFRTLRGQPNGSLLFRTPTAFFPDTARLAELNLEATVLSGASDRARLVGLPADPIDFDALLALEGHAQPHAALCTILRPADPWGGRLLFLADSAAFADEFASHEHYAHGELLRVLLTSLLSGERMVASRIALRGPDVLPQLAEASRARWHATVVLLIPALFGLMFLVRGRGTRSRGSAARLARALALPTLVSIPVAILAAELSPRLDSDWTRDGRNRLTDAEHEVFAPWLAEPLELDLVFSAPGSLPPEFKPLVREAQRACESLAREFDTVELRRVRPESMDESERAELAQAGIVPLPVSTTQAEVTRLFRIHAHLRLRRGDREEILSFPSVRSFRSLAFRLAHALTRLERGAPTRIAIFSQPPRLSPAEATLEYQRKGLFAPRESDVFSELEELLEEFDFDVRRLRPESDAIPSATDALFWLQPRRDILPMLERLADWLHEGGHAVVAGQHFRILSRQLERAGLQPRYWPEPQFLDLERAYLPELGIRLERELVLDASHGSLELETRVDATDGPPSYTRLETSQPFLVRAAVAAVESGAGRSLGELLLPFPSRIEYDRAALDARGLRVTPWIVGAGKHWTYRWQGGDVPPEVLRGELPPGDDDASDLRRFEAGAIYAALFEGPFPAAELIPVEQGAEAGSVRLELLDERSARAQRDGRLLLVADSKVFENEQLGLAEYDHELLALRVVAASSLDARVASFLDKAPSSPSIPAQTEGARLWWRLIVLGAFPALLLLVGAGRRWRA